MVDIQNFIGRGRSEADRKREYRQRIETDRTNVRQISDKTPPEIEKELEIEKDSSAKSTTTKRKRFEKPTLSQIEQYCIERNNNVNAEQFFDYYESNGWKVGKNSMKDWKAAVRTWERNRYDQPVKSKNSKADAMNVVKELMEEYEQSATDSESAIDVTDSVQY